MTDERTDGFPDGLTQDIIALFRNRGVSGTMRSGPCVHKLELPDSQRVVINYNPASAKLWLAGASIAAEYSRHGDVWQSLRDGGEFMADLSRIIGELQPAQAEAGQGGQLTVINTASTPTLADPDHSLVPEVSRFRWSYLLLLAAVALVGYRWLMPPNPESAALAPSATAMTPVSAPEKTVQQCQPNAPATGASRNFGSAAAVNGQTAEVSISNKHNRDMVVYFTKPGSAMPLHAIYLRAGSESTMPANAGEYELMFSIGNIWCNFEDGFKNGLITKLSNSFTLKPDQTLAFEMQSTGGQAGDFRIFMRGEPETAAPPIQVISGGDMQLQRAADGHYYMHGSINGSPVLFLIDTGASLTTLKQQVAVAGGIRDCRASQSQTANGIVDVCIGTIPEIRIGAYIINNAVVVANPKTEANLLGMNVLGQFSIKTENGVMTLSKP